MKILPETQSIVPYNSQALAHETEIIEIHPEPIAEESFFKCPTVEDIAQAEKELEADRRLSYWDWLKNVLR